MSVYIFIIYLSFRVPGAHGAAHSHGDAGSAHLTNAFLTVILRLRFLAMNRLAASLGSRDEETKHEDKKDETLHAC